VAEIEGTVAAGYEAVRDMLSSNIDSGADVGASVAVVHDGDLVVDIWGGHVDEARTQPWRQDTIINVWSTTKTMAALCALMLADRGELDLHAPVARYWPEFKEGGKEGVEVRHLLSHSAGLSGWQQPMQPEDLYDWDKATSLLAAQEPWWEPGTASGYHAITQGYLVGEVVRRITGVTIGRFFADEVAGPVGADFQIGTPPEHDGRVAKVIPPPPLALEGADPASIAVRTLSNPPLSAEQSWEIPWRRAEIPAAGGHGNARSVATIQSALACGGVTNEVRLLSEAGCESALEEVCYTPDLVLGVPIRFGMGYGLNSPDTPLSPNPRMCFWGGWGGSLVVVDLDARLCVAYVMNKMGEGTVGDFRGAGIAFAAFGAVGAL
jgi:CubicO group peptidase (beta-lactamase class C family)